MIRLVGSVVIFGIYNTANGGISWERQTIPNIMFPDFEEIQFINDLTGWVVGYDGTYFTNNGGLTWHHNLLESIFLLIYILLMKILVGFQIAAEL